MTRMAVALILVAALAIPAAASAAPAPRAGFGIGQILKTLGGGTITVPPEWDGLWSSTDSIFECPDILIGTASGVDTICGGESYDQSPPGTFEMSCTGTASATTLDVTCTGGGDIFPDCRADIVMTIHAERTGDFYRSVMTMIQSYSGTVPGCDETPDYCSKIVSEGIRTGPAPPSFCTTPMRRATWGRIKTLYR